MLVTDVYNGILFRKIFRENIFLKSGAVYVIIWEEYNEVVKNMGMEVRQTWI